MDKKIKKKRSPAIYFLLFLSFLFLIFFGGDLIRSFFFKHTHSAQENFYTKGRILRKRFWDICQNRQLKEELLQLQKENQKLLSQLIELKELQKENKELREALGLGLKNDLELLEAKIIAFSPERNFFFINKGAKEGVLEGMWVISFQKVLIGRIKKVFQNDSLVELITSPAIKISVYLGEDKLLGIAKGKNAFLLVENVPKEKELQENDLVLTANLQKELPANLLVGKVIEIQKSDLAPFQELKIKPLFNLNNLEKIFIILDF